MTEVTTTLLHNAIGKAVLELAPDVVPSQQAMMRDSLEMFVKRAIKKFNDGQREHGGDLRKRNHHNEMLSELIDLLWYHQASAWPKDERGEFQKLDTTIKP